MSTVVVRDSLAHVIVRSGAAVSYRDGGPIPASAVPYIPAGTLVSTNVQDAIAEVETEWIGAIGALNAGQIAYKDQANDFIAGQKIAGSLIATQPYVNAGVAAAEAFANAAVAVETDRAEASEAANAAAIAAETGRATAAEGVLTGNLAAEIARATAAEALLIPLAQRAAANGVATLDAGSHVPLAQLSGIGVAQLGFDVATQVELDAETARATAAEGANTAAIAVNTGNIAANAAAIAAETGRATAAEAANTALINALDAAIDQANIAYINIANIFSANQTMGNNQAAVAKTGLLELFVTPGNGFRVRNGVDGSDWFTVARVSGGVVEFNLDGGYTLLGPGATQYSTARLSINTGSTTSAGAVVRGQASQSSNLSEWQDSTGALLASMQSTGSLRAVSFGSPSGTNALLRPNGDTGGFRLDTAADANKGLVIKRFSATQSALLFQAQDETGANLLSIGAGGILTVAQSLNAGSATGKIGVSSSADPNVFIQSAAAASRPLIVKGAASQTASLQEWQDSTGAVMGTFSSAGGLTVGGTLSTTWRAIITSGAVGNIALTIKAAASQTANLIEWQDSASTVLSRITSTGQFSGPSYYNLGGTRLMSLSGTGVGVSFTDTVASDVVAVMKGAASQTGDLQQWQDSSGNVLAFVNNAGAARFNVLAATLSAKAFLSMNADTGGMVIATQADANKGLVIRRNSSSQSANLMEFQTESGSIKSTIANNGAFNANGGLVASNSANTGTDPAVSFLSAAAATRVVTAKAAASQSVNIEEWQDSTAAVLSAVNSVGSIRAVSFGSTVASKALLTPNGDTGGFVITTINDANKGLAIRRNSATQSANLLEVQNESGTALGWFTSLGALLAGQAGNGSAFGGSNLSGVILTAKSAGVTNVGVAVRGVASQTGDLQQWQDSAGGVLHAITAAGLPQWKAAASVQTTVGALGAASALPAFPTKYLKVVDDAGTTLVVPAYAAA